MTENKYIKNNRKLSGGYTLMEVLISVGLFALVVALNLNIFINVVKVQRRAVEVQNVTDNARYAMEVITRELRTMNVSMTKSSCTATANSQCLDNPLNNTTVHGLAFVSGSENRLGFELESYFDGASGSVKFDDDTTDANPAVDITSQNVEVTDLSFIISNMTSQSQPKITVILTVSSRNKPVGESDSVTLQTTISPRQLSL